MEQSTTYKIDDLDFWLIVAIARVLEAPRFDPCGARFSDVFLRLEYTPGAVGGAYRWKVREHLEELRVRGYLRKTVASWTDRKHERRSARPHWLVTEEGARAAGEWAREVVGV